MPKRTTKIKPIKGFAVIKPIKGFAVVSLGKFYCTDFGEKYYIVYLKRKQVMRFGDYRPVTIVTHAKRRQR